MCLCLHSYLCLSDTSPDSDLITLIDCYITTTFNITTVKIDVDILLCAFGLGLFLQLGLIPLYPIQGNLNATANNDISDNRVLQTCMTTV